VYARVYLNETGDRFEGKCPKCSKPVEVRAGGLVTKRFLLPR